MYTKDILYSLFTNRKLVCLGLCALSIGSLASAYIAQYVFDLQPCILCLYQRAPYFIVLALSLVAFLFTCKNNKITSYLILACAFSFLCGSVIAFYHSGVELKWWESFLEKCNADFDFNDPKAYLAALEQSKAVRCDEIPWADPIFELSMANYNTGLSLIYAALTAKAGLMIRARDYK
jgi:disulfide bond formation protein DsbB